MLLLSLLLCFKNVITFIVRAPLPVDRIVLPLSAEGFLARCDCQEEFLQVDP